jgi:hypothetical protein
MHFHANAGLIFLTDELTYDRYLVDTGATLSIVPCSHMLAHLDPFSKGKMGNLSSLGVSFKKNCAISRQAFYSNLLQPAVAGPILGIDFLRKFKVTVSPEINQIQFACSAMASPALHLPSVAPPAHPLLSAASSALPFVFSLTPVPAPVPIPPPTEANSSQPHPHM